MIRYLSISNMLVVCLAGMLAQGQQGDAVPGEKVRPLRPVKEVTSDTRLDMVGKLPMQVEVHPAVAMTQQDKDLAAAAAKTIRQRAEFFDLGFGEGDWQQAQLECPAFPQHLLLRFTRNRGAGDVSMFAASIPRGPNGQVRVIPILRRGYSLISPAPVNKVTIGAFNQIRAEEHLGEKQDWPAVGLCFAVLSSARWSEPRENVTLTTLGSETLQLLDKGGVSVALELGEPAPGRWVETYDGGGQLEKTEYTPFGSEIWRPLPAVATDQKGKPLPAPQEPQGKPLPTGPEPAGRPIPPALPGDSPNKPQ